MFYIIIIGAVVGFLAICLGVYMGVHLDELRYSKLIILIGYALESICFIGSLALLLLSRYRG